MWNKEKWDSLTQKEKEEDDIFPINPINSELVMRNLIELPLGVKKAKWDWHDILMWGDGDTPGSVILEISPLGSYKAITRKMITDLEGNNSWICKNVFDFNEKGINKNEADLASKIYENLTKADLDLDSANRDFNNFEKYVLKIAGRMKLDHPTIMFFEKLKKINTDYYICTFNYRGQGVEAPGSMKTIQFHINLLYDKSKGLIRCWGNEISTPIKGSKWQPQPSEWDELFAPSQKVEEISKAINDMFMTY